VRLTVINPLPPHVLAAVPDTTFTTVVVKFDNRVQPSSAQNAANYTIPGLTVSAAVVDASGSNVVLTTSQQADGANYNLTVRDVRELTGLNAIVPNPTSFVAAKEIVVVPVRSVAGLTRRAQISESGSVS